MRWMYLPWMRPPCIRRQRRCAARQAAPGAPARPVLLGSGWHSNLGACLPALLLARQRRGLPSLQALALLLPLL